MSRRNDEATQIAARLLAAEERLKTITDRYSLATSSAKVGIWDWNLETNDFHLDANVKGFLGYNDHEIPNDIEQWATFIHPDDKEAVMIAAQDCIEGRSSEYVYEHRMLHKDGSVRWFMVRGKVIRDGEGKAVRFVGTDTDITERRELEEQVRRISNELQSRIGRDLHDSLGQELTAVALKLRAFERRLQDGRDVRAEDLRDIRVLVERAMDTTRSLSRGLSPVSNSADLSASLAQLADDAVRIYGIVCRIELAEDLPATLPQGHCIELYRIVQESITNAVRHGGASEVSVEGRILAGRLVLSIADDGVGQDIPDPAAPSLGLKIMQYRARSLGGTVTISRRRKSGTVVVCSCPIRQ